MSRSLIAIWLMLLAALALSGCDSKGPITSELLENTDQASGSEPVALRSECEGARELGSITGIGGSNDYLIGAPHGTFDLYTAEIAEAVCSALNANCVVARNYVVDNIRMNVNRPTEGAGLSPQNEPQTERATCIFEYYVFRAESLLAAADTKFYVEIHGASSIQDVEIATIGFSIEQTTRFKALLQAAWNGTGGSSRAILIQPNDTISLGATASKTIGMMSRLRPALHIELPRAMRQNERGQVIQFLQNGLFSISREL